MFCFFFFFSSRRRHTRLQGDWSSDVCSSDLRPGESRWLLAKQRPPRTPAAQPAEAPQRPVLQEVSQFMLLEREVEMQYRPRMLEALQGKVNALVESVRDQTPACSQCGQPMRRQDTEDRKSVV